jgi:hypothetical protein
MAFLGMSRQERRVGRMGLPRDSHRLLFAPEFHALRFT